eukprot:TRINITY_DN12598_c0_g1_i1.p1 TRINITY_DN12598_c0_g1~~TRINITY_DN12598_c0_g1_i1.p1  ORF type:complete len:460 (+),score=100.31 TRINITY_DN12598_c0_g1_i1:79-1458(+)
MRLFVLFLFVGSGAALLHRRAVEPSDADVTADPRHITPGEPSAPLTAGPGADLSRAEAEFTNHAAHATVVGMCVTIVLGLAIFSMAASKDKATSKNTWLMLDMVVAIFIAVLYYQAIACALEKFERDLGFAHGATLTHFVHAVLLFLAAVVVSFKIRESKTNLAVFCACGAHFVSFSSMGFGVALQEHLHEHHEELGVLVAGPLLAVILLLLYNFFVFFRKKNDMDGVDDEWEDSIDDVENDYIAMAIAVVLTLTINWFIVGKYNSLEDIEGIHQHTPLQRKAMLIYAVISLPAGAFLASKVAEYGAASKSTGVKKTCAVGVSVITMMVAWAFLMAGQWEVAASHHAEDRVIRRLHFATLATICGLLLVLGLSRMQPRGASTLAAAEAAIAKLALVAVGLVVGFSWEQVFNEAVETMAEGSETAELQLKFGLAIGLGGLIIPMYAWYFKPAVVAQTGGD